MRPFLSRRLSGLVQSDIRSMTRECDRVGGINLGQGLCELPTPSIVRAGAARAIDEGRNAYSYPEGVPELREAIAKKLEREHGLSFDPASEVVVTVGASGAFAATVTALLDPGDGLLLFEPFYGYHLNTAIVAGLEPQLLELEAPRFRLEGSRLRAAIRPNTRAIVICTPSNPCGRMFSVAELEVLDEIATEHDLLVITDEVYEYIRFDGREHVAPATVGRLRERTVSITSLSKTFSITGWRIGYAAAKKDMANAITLVNDLYYVCAPTPLQIAVADGFEGPREYLDDLATTFQHKRDKICGALASGGMEPVVPEGAYYVLADVAGLGYESSRAAALGVLERTGVASVPGSAFYSGDAGTRFLRFCFAKEDEELDEACRRLEKRAVR